MQRPTHSHDLTPGMRVSERGSTLLMSLLFLLILTVLGIASVSTTGIQERMAHNVREQNISLQAAESAVNDAERWLETFRNGTPPQVITAGSADCSTLAMVWNETTAAHANIQNHDYAWWEANGCRHGLDSTGTDIFDLGFLGDEDSSANQQPFFIIQERDRNTLQTRDRDSLGQGITDSDSDPRLYRIYAYAVGQSGATDILIESHYSIATFQ